jgi:2C-methyl-D-erythritol 2,4-cyclodiphosphate synthase
MISNIAGAVNIDRTAVNVKATTTEGLGFAGKGEGIAAYAACTLRRGTEGGSGA